MPGAVETHQHPKTLVVECCRNSPIVAVGTHRQNHTGELASNLTHAERIIVAGGAYGIDAAHRAALATGGQTLAVMVGGLDRLYPSGNRELLARVGDLGLLASEMPPGSAPTKWRFLARNRILGALSGATVVVEAGYRSSSLNVAARAAQLGRPVGAVPGPVTSVSSAGTHRLLRQGVASLVTDAADISALFGSADENSQTFSRDPSVSHPMRRPPRSL
ncbi:DNA-protecting protein DprA [Leucobacter tenebrionis]|nr:DNA-protecting protein DprA [Leucobacter tenebrionis]